MEAGSSHRWCRSCLNLYNKTHRKYHRDLDPIERQKANCRAYTKVLIRRGQLKKQPCEDCGNPVAQAHHENYNDPRNVRWKCRVCHQKHHDENNHIATPVVPGVWHVERSQHS